MLIGKLASESGFSRDTIRYYEKRGLLHTSEFDRYENSYKIYPSQVLGRLIQIRQLKELGFTLTEIASLLESFGQERQPCTGLPMQLDEKISLFDKKITLLEQYKQKLLVVRQACDGECANTQQDLPNCFGI